MVECIEKIVGRKEDGGFAKCQGEHNWDSYGLDVAGRRKRKMGGRGRHFWTGGEGSDWEVRDASGKGRV